MIVAVLASIALVPAPASAYNSYNGAAYVKGGWATSSPEGVVNLDTNDESGAACLWQAILWADKAWIADKGRTFRTSDIDGLFGWNTHQATRNWQNKKGLAADGSAGKNSWAKASVQRTYWSGGGGESSTYYKGKTASGEDTGRGFWLVSDTQDRWRFYMPGSYEPGESFYKGRSVYASYETSTKKSRCL